MATNTEYAPEVRQPRNCGCIPGTEAGDAGTQCYFCAKLEQFQFQLDQQSYHLEAVEFAYKNLEATFKNFRDCLPYYHSNLEAEIDAEINEAAEAEPEPELPSYPGIPDVLSVPEK